MADLPERLVRIGVIVRAHGIRGELSVRLDEPGSRTLLSQKQVWLRSAGGIEPRAVVGARPGSSHLLLRLAGVEDRSAAEGLRGTELLVPRASLPPVEEGEYYVADLVGLRVVDAQGAELGRVESVFEAGAAPVLEIGGDREWQLPLAEPFIKRVDLAGGVLVVEPPEEVEEASD
jgi:16S rRNA processing protein RimM